MSTSITHSATTHAAATHSATTQAAAHRSADPHDHAGHDHDHAHAPVAAARGPAFSLLRLSALQRMAGALALAGVVWLAVWWALA